MTSCVTTTAPIQTSSIYVMTLFTVKTKSTAAWTILTVCVLITFCKIFQCIRKLSKRYINSCKVWKWRKKFRFLYDVVISLFQEICPTGVTSWCFPPNFTSVFAMSTFTVALPRSVTVHATTFIAVVTVLINRTVCDWKRKNHDTSIFIKKHVLELILLV